jgi:asparagine synthase (glutamine-hydrolysing)
MCGIVAVYSRRAPVASAIVEKATKTLYHRGPDGQCTWVAPNAQAALGHARLSIIDLTREINQSPMRTRPCES